MTTDVVLPSEQVASQATRIEQARAVAEVQAAVVVAQQVPRDVPTAVESMRETCGHKALAERAFFRFPRAGQQITGPSIHLARELARVWGNVQYGINELRRDDAQHQSEMIAWAWDVQTNTRASTTFIVPHARDTKQGVKALVDLRDVYENNSNNGARRVREMIFSVLPSWFVDDAKDRCASTLRDGGGKPLAQRIADTVRAFDSVGVDETRLEAKIGRPAKEWTDFDVAALNVVGASLRRGEATVDEEFPLPASRPVSVSELTGAAQGDPADQRRPLMASNPQIGKIHMLAEQLGLNTDFKGDRSDYLAMLSEIACHPVESAKALTKTEATWVIEAWTSKVAMMPTPPSDAA